jgi:hypothetical protein
MPQLSRASRAEDRFQYQDNPCGICDQQSDIEEAVYPFSISVSIPQALYIHLSFVAGAAGLLKATVPGAHSHPTPATKTISDIWYV